MFQKLSLVLLIPVNVHSHNRLQKTHQNTHTTQPGERKPQTELTASLSSRRTPLSSGWPGPLSPIQCTKWSGTHMTLPTFRNPAEEKNLRCRSAVLHRESGATHSNSLFGQYIGDTPIIPDIYYSNTLFIPRRVCPEMEKITTQACPAHHTTTIITIPAHPHLHSLQFHLNHLM
jgi:hypothetical protein